MNRFTELLAIFESGVSNQSLDISGKRRDTVIDALRFAALASKSHGQIAYETDVYRAPLYCDGKPRKPWEQLPAWAKEDWERHPTPREYRKPDLGAFSCKP